MNILVIGNGFDLAHGLPTTYGDFLWFEMMNRITGFGTKNAWKIDINHVRKMFPSKSKNDETKLLNYIYEHSKKIRRHWNYYNIWIYYFLSVFSQMQEENMIGWIDFENEISSVIQALDSARITLKEQLMRDVKKPHLEKWQKNRLRFFLSSTNNKKLVILHKRIDSENDKRHKEGRKLLSELFPTSSEIMLFWNYMTTGGRIKETDKMLTSYLAEVLLEELNRLTMNLEFYLSSFIDYSECMQLKDITSLKIDHVLSFNYTDTFQKVYGSRFVHVDYDYIHGKAKLDGTVDNCNLVLGIDEYLQDGKEDTDNEFIQFKKFYQRIYKMTGNDYRKWFDDYEDSDDTHVNIYIYGHSLDVTDKDILQYLIDYPDATTTIFYHSKEALGKQIANLVKVIGEQKLIEYTGGRTQKIIFRQTSGETMPDSSPGLEDSSTDTGT